MNVAAVILIAGTAHVSKMVNRSMLPQELYLALTQAWSRRRCCVGVRLSFEMWLRGGGW